MEAVIVQNLHGDFSVLEMKIRFKISQSVEFYFSSSRITA